MKENDAKTENKDIISRIIQRRKDSETDLALFLEGMQESFEFYKSKQYDPKVEKILKARGLPYHVINICKEVVNTMSGFQRQNRTEPVVNPIEGTDERIAEVMGRTVKWSLELKNNNNVPCMSFKDKSIGGLGVVFTYIDFSEDPVNGDIRLKHLSPFDVKFDPTLKEMDLSDCRYIIYEGRLEKEDLKRRFKEHKDKINDMEPSDTVANFSGETRTTNKKDRGLRVTEHWYRELFDEECYMDDETGDIIVFDGDEDEKAAFLENKKVEFFTRTKKKIKLQIVIEDKLLVYDDDNPYGIDYYPFSFDFGYYDPAVDEWELKLCGDVDRSLKDVNREKNKRRSQMSAIVAKMPHNGFYVEEGSVDDENKLEKSGGVAKIIHYRRGFQRPQQIEPLQLPSALIQLEQLSNEDKYIAGMKPELLGQMGEKGAPLGLHQMRQKQALLGVQEQFDNHGICIRQIGRIMIALITKHFTKDKILRIVGSDLSFNAKKMDIKKQIKGLESFVPRTQEEIDQFNQKVQDMKIAMLQLEEEEAEFWGAWDSLSENSKFDIQIDESTNSTTYKIATEQMLMSLNQQPGAVPYDILIEMSSLPKSIKEKLLNSYYQQQQQQQQMLQEEREMKMQVEQQRMETERMKAMAGMQGKINVNSQVQ